MAGVVIKNLETLLILNFTMDENHPLLSHQTQAVNQLAKKFKFVYVITGTVGSYSPPSNVKVFSSNWIQGRRILNAARFLRIAVPLILKVKPSVVFSHMTDVQSCLLGPLTKILRTSHFLWYAHAHKSVWLRLALHLVTGIITSTSGSCPVKGSKVKYIGQAVDPIEFPFAPTFKFNPLKFIHVGRFDPSKRVETLIETLIQFRNLHPDVTLTLVGDPSTDLSRKYSESIKEKYIEQVNLGWLDFKSGVPRSEVPRILHEHDLFVHAYSGSLDKSLIEATLVGIPVATINSEYQAQFGNWSKLNNPSLLQEVIALYSGSDEAISKELLLRRKFCEENHSSSSWINLLTHILLSCEKSKKRYEKIVK